MILQADHGCQYNAAQIAAFTHRHDLARSVGRTGVWDNAASGPLAASPCANPISDACPSRGKGEARVARLNVRLAVAGPRRERPALKLAPLENRVVLLDEGAGSLPVVGGLAAVDVVGRLEI